MGICTISTSDTVMTDARLTRSTIAYPRCTESDNYFTSDCGSSAWSYGLFISWNIISM